MRYIKKFDIEINTFYKIVSIKTMFKDKQCHHY